MLFLCILGGGTTKDNRPSEQARQRLIKTVEIHHKYDKIVISSKGTYRPGFKHTITEAASMKRYLLRRGVPEDKIICEEQSQDTFSNAYYTRKLLTKYEPYSLTVVTSKFHIPKTKYVFSLVYPHKKIKYIAVSDATLGKKALANRKISEKLVLQFYKKHLRTTYGVIPGEMKTIKKFLDKHNFATSGKKDKYQQELTTKIKKAINPKVSLLY